LSDTLHSLVSSNFIVSRECYSPAEIVEEVMEEYDDNDSFSRSWSSSSVLDSCQGNPSCERAAHPRSRGKEEWPTTNAIDEKREADSLDPVCCADDSVEPILELWIGYANVGEDFAALR